MRIVIFGALRTEPSLSTEAVLGPKSAKSAKYRAPGYFAGILTKPGYTWKYPSSFFLNFVRFASFRFCPRPALSTQTQTGTLREIEGKEGGTKTKNTLCFPSKFPETQSAGGAASVFLLFGKVRIQANQAEARAVEEHGWWRRRRRAGKSSRRSATRRRAELSRAREDLASEREEAAARERHSRPTKIAPKASSTYLHLEHLECSR